MQESEDDQPAAKKLKKKVHETPEEPVSSEDTLPTPTSASAAAADDTVDGTSQPESNLDKDKKDGGTKGAATKSDKNIKVDNPDPYEDTLNCIICQDILYNCVR